jgi:hypothetical protein
MYLLLFLLSVRVFFCMLCFLLVLFPPVLFDCLFVLFFCSFAIFLAQNDKNRGWGHVVVEGGRGGNTKRRGRADVDAVSQRSLFDGLSFFLDCLLRLFVCLELDDGVSRVTLLRSPMPVSSAT